MDYATVDFNCSTSTIITTPDTGASIGTFCSDLITAVDRDLTTKAATTATNSCTI